MSQMHHWAAKKNKNLKIIAFDFCRFLSATCTDWKRIFQYHVIPPFLWNIGGSMFWGRRAVLWYRSQYCLLLLWIILWHYDGFHKIMVLMHTAPSLFWFALFWRWNRLHLESHILNEIVSFCRSCYIFCAKATNCFQKQQHRTKICEESYF